MVNPNFSAHRYIQRKRHETKISKMLQSGFVCEKNLYLNKKLEEGNPPTKKIIGVQTDMHGQHHHSTLTHAVGTSLHCTPHTNLSHKVS